MSIKLLMVLLFTDYEGMYKECSRSIDIYTEYCVIFEIHVLVVYSHCLSLSLFLSLFILVKTHNYINKCVKKTLLTMGVRLKYRHPLTILHG